MGCGGAYDANPLPNSSSASSASSAASSTSSSSSTSSTSSSSASSSGSGNVHETGGEYEGVGTHPFVAAAFDPLSTFAADVDTASYDIFRRDLDRFNALPHPDSVRVEEYINNFAYDYPAPESSEPFRISLASAPNFFNRNTHVLSVGIQASDGEEKAKNLVFLVDRSSSMVAYSKLPLVKVLLKETLNLLAPADTVTLVTYTSKVELVLPPTSAAKKSLIEAAIDSIEAQGVTNGAQGIQMAYEQARAAYINGGVNHVILCTDGDFNVGVTSTEELIDLIRQEREGGITFTALGFGTSGINDAMLEATSNAGDGIYAVISSRDHAVNYVQTRLISNLSYVARDMKIQVEFNPQLVSHYRLIGYENRAIEDGEFEDDEVDGGEIGAGHRVTALYELVLKDSALPEIENAPAVVEGEDYSGPVSVASDDYVLVKVRYKPVDAVSDDPALEVSASLKSLAAELDAADEDLRWAVAMAAFAEILKGSPFAERAYLEQIGVIFQEQRERDADRAEFYRLYQRALPNL
jgi:Ca-activated chloride channel family protein